MNPNINDICNDPLFQLNFAIWLTQPQPPQNFYINPILYQAGLNIYSIAPFFVLPPDIRLAISENNLDCQDGARPDLVLEQKNQRKFCILECKASSFGPNSSTASQARALLLISGPIISELLGPASRGQKEGILCYLSGSNQIEMMGKTFRTLAEEIAKLKLKTGIYGFFGIKTEQSTMLLEYSEEIKNFLNIIENSPVKILSLEEGVDPRPLYFIPYDPNLQQQQTKEDQEFCRRILFERILSNLISSIGGAPVPSSMTFSTQGLLNSATFEVYEKWDDNDSKHHLRKIVKDFLQNNVISSINEPTRKCINYEPGKGWVFNLKDKETHDELLNQLMKFKPETLDLSKKVDPTLFDNMEN